MTVEKYKLSHIKRCARAAGLTFEDIIIASCKYYEENGIALIEKTPEPMKPIRRLDNGKFVAVYTKSAQPDFKGTLNGGQSICFEAKHTDTGIMRRNVVSAEQERVLNIHEQMGAECYVLISFGFRKFYKIPWNIFRDMDLWFSRKHIKETDHAELDQYEIKYIGGVLKFLYQ